MKDDLDDNLRDRLVAASKGAVGFFPVLGGPLGEAIEQVIPGLRQDRIVKYIRNLEGRVTELEDEFLSKELRDPEKLDLIERGAYLAARSVSEERIDHIASIVYNGLKSDEANFIRRKRLLSLFGEIDADEVLLLNAYGQSYGNPHTDAWDKVERPKPMHLGSSTEEIDRDKLYELGKHNLLRLGLLRNKPVSAKRGELPPYDPKTGGFKSHTEISYLGRMLLREMGIELPIE